MMKTVLSNIIDNGFKLHTALIKCRNGVVEDILIIDNREQELLDNVSYDLREFILLPQFFNIHCHLGESLYALSPEDM